MKRDLIWGWIFIALALLMMFCIIIDCINANWASLPICSFTFGMNLMNAIIHFRDYKKHKEYKNQYSIMLSENTEILSSDNFINS